MEAYATASWRDNPRFHSTAHRLFLAGVVAYACMTPEHDVYIPLAMLSIAILGCRMALHLPGLTCNMHLGSRLTSVRALMWLSRAHRLRHGVERYFGYDRSSLICARLLWLNMGLNIVLFMWQNRGRAPEDAEVIVRQACPSHTRAQYSTHSPTAHLSSPAR